MLSICVDNPQRILSGLMHEARLKYHRSHLWHWNATCTNCFPCGRSQQMKQGKNERGRRKWKHLTPENTILKNIFPVTRLLISSLSLFQPFCISGCFSASQKKSPCCSFWQWPFWCRGWLPDFCEEGRNKNETLSIRLFTSPILSGNGHQHTPLVGEKD